MITEQTARELIEAVKTFLATAPAFRLHPMDATGSFVRRYQDDQIAAEDAFRAALARAEKECT